MAQYPLTYHAVPAPVQLTAATAVPSALTMDYVCPPNTNPLLSVGQVARTEHGLRRNVLSGPFVDF
jgi:hypothetical protein